VHGPRASEERCAARQCHSRTRRCGCVRLEHDTDDLLSQAEQERQASVIRAEGEAEAAQTISKALEKAGDGLLTIRRIEASKEIAQTLSNARNVSYIPGGSNML